MTLLHTTYTIIISIAWHKNLSCYTNWNLSLSLSQAKLSPSFVVMDLILFVYCFIIEGYNVYVTIEFFPHIIIMEDFLSMGPSDNDFGDVDTLLNL